MRGLPPTPYYPGLASAATANGERRLPHSSISLGGPNILTQAANSSARYETC